MRTWFQARQRREQVLLTAFVVMGGVLWLTGAAGRVRSHWRSWASVRSELATQQIWLDKQKEILTAATAAVKNLDPARTLEATKLVATLSQLATSAGSSPVIDTPVTQRTPQFAYHVAKVSLRRTTLPVLLKFYDALNAQAPYINLEQISLQTERAAPGMLNVTMQISATQIVKP